MKPLVLFHGNCTDGFTAAWVADRALGGAEIVPCHYGDPPPDVRGRDVYVVDFSWPRETMIRMFSQAHRLLVLDHHETAQADLEGLAFCAFDMKRSGARLAWDHFNPGVKPPPLVLYVEDRDLWRKSLQGSEAVSAFLFSKKRDLAVWDALSKMSAEDLAWRGEAVLEYQQTLVEGLVKNARPAEIAGYRVLAVNSPVLQSEIGNELGKTQVFGAVWFEREDGRRIWSLRSKPDGVNVAEIAKRLGGGGHAHAAGFQV